MDSTDATRAKAAIRAAALARRDALPPGVRAQYGKEILRQILALQEFTAARTVFAYYGFGSEIDTTPLLQAVLEDNKKLLLPRVNRKAGVLDLYEVRSLQTDLRAGVWGIPEPNPEVCPPGLAADIDLVIAPGAAFDRKGGRIGYGKGYYDKLLANRHPLIVAGAFNVQLVDAVPLEPHDVLVDLLITETGQPRRK
ncbi:MAG TPA: 5-formyltetrahydrofolate cyclo-ligase [Bryobacteraceae bacterium]